MALHGGIAVAAPQSRPDAARRSYRTALVAAVAAITAARLLWLAAATDLYPDEAQYWFWAQHLAFGYYSKPPLLAWLIAATTGLFGDSEFAVRLSAPLLQAAAALLVYAIAARLYDRRTGFWSGLAYASLPGVSASAAVISTDAPLLLCWAAALYALIRARERGAAGRWWIAVGVALGCGLLAKYAMAYWVLSALGLAVLDRDERRHLRPLLAAVALGAVLYLPNLWWNWRDGFVSYLHTGDNADLDGTLFHPGAMLTFAASQIGVIGPVFAAVLVWLAARRRDLSEPRVRLLAAFAAPPLALMVALSLLSRAHANWAAPAYVSAIVLVVAAMLRANRRRLLAAAVALNVIVAAAVFGGEGGLAAAGIAVPAKYDPLHRLRGWRALGSEVAAALHRHPGLMLMTDDRETLAALIYYVRPHPFDAVKWSVGNRIKDQWDLTNNLAKYPGRSFLLVSNGKLVPEMRPSFAAIEPLRTVAIPIAADQARRYTLYIARDFRGYRYR